MCTEVSAELFKALRLLTLCTVHVFRTEVQFKFMLFECRVSESRHVGKCSPFQISVEIRRAVVYVPANKYAPTFRNVPFATSAREELL